MLTPCQKCLRSFLTLPSAFILSDFVDYTEFSGVSLSVRMPASATGSAYNQLVIAAAQRLAIADPSVC